MGAPPIYSLSAAGTRKSGGMLSVSPTAEVNGVNTKVMLNSAYERHLKVAIEDEPSNGSMCNSEVISPGFFGRPLGAGALQQKWNPFKKKSGILGVIHAQSKRNRVVSKHGKLNTFRRPEENQEQHRYLKDFFTSMIDLSWSWTLFSFAMSFFFSWMFFAVIWYLLVLIHGDLSPVEERDPDHKVCVENIKDFTSCFLFSLETQHTIGYGVRATTEQCFLALVIMPIQCIVGVVIQACMAGIVFAKFTKPTMRAETILFSKNALITLRNGSLYLVCRIGDLRPTHLLESHVSGQMVKKVVTEEGEEFPYHLERIEFGTELDGTQDFFQMFWPISVSHKIDEDSPLWEMSPRDILEKQFEIIVTMEGITPETGNTIQVRTSYLPNEILWGYRFDQSCVSYDKTVAKYAVSLTALNKFVQDKTPRCSGKELEEQKAKRALILENQLQEDLTKGQEMGGVHGPEQEEEDQVDKENEEDQQELPVDLDQNKKNKKRRHPSSESKRSRESLDRREVLSGDVVPPYPSVPLNGDESYISALLDGVSGRELDLFEDTDKVDRQDRRRTDFLNGVEAGDWEDKQYNDGGNLGLPHDGSRSSRRIGYRKMVGREEGNT